MGSNHSNPITWPRLTFLIGKGGAGKSTVAAALATCLAASRPTVLAELDQRGSAARLLGLGPEDCAATGGRLELHSLTARRELERFINRIVPVRMISNRMLGSRTFNYVTAALPGLEAFLLLSRLAAMAGEAARDDRFVVVDGLSTGASLELLSVAEGVRNLAGSGTLSRLALELEGFLSDPNRFGAAIVVQPQEMALKEAMEAAPILRDKLKVGHLIAILNGVAPRLFTAAETGQASAVQAEYAALVARRAQLDAAAQRARERLGAEGIAVIELPMLFTPVMRKAEIARLARALRSMVAA